MISKKVFTLADCQLDLQQDVLSSDLISDGRGFDLTGQTKILDSFDSFDFCFNKAGVEIQKSFSMVYRIDSEDSFWYDFRFLNYTLAKWISDNSPLSGHKNFALSSVRWLSLKDTRYRIANALQEWAPVYNYDEAHFTTLRETKGMITCDTITSWFPDHFYLSGRNKAINFYVRSEIAMIFILWLSYVSTFPLYEWMQEQEQEAAHKHGIEAYS